MSLKGERAKPLEAGARLDERFEIVKFLGAGNFGEVYEARQLVFGHVLRKVALKLYAPDKVTPQNYRSVFGDAVALVGLHNDEPPPEVARKLIQVFDIGVVREPSERAFMAMQLVPGGHNLDHAVRRFRKAGGMPVATSLNYARQLLVVLGWMHTLENAAVHGDLKPDNILLTPDLKEVILTDFGLASRIAVGTQGGAIAYQSPEHLVQQGSMANAGPQADIYSFGLLWYEMLTGRHPFADVGLQATADGDERAYIRAHQAARKWSMRAARHADDTERIIPPSEINPELREEPVLEQMIACCLREYASDRFPNAQVLLTEIDGYLQKDGKKSINIPTPLEIRAPEVVSLPTKEAEHLVNDALTLLKTDEPEQHRRALTLAITALEKKPGLLAAKLAKARAHFTLGEKPEAQRLLVEAQRAAPNSPEVLDELAWFYERQGNGDVAQSFRIKAAAERSKSSHSRAR